MVGLGLIINLIALFLSLLVFVPWMVNNWSGWFTWFRGAWEWWYTLSFFPSWIPVFALACWRFAAEISDPSYPAPRNAISHENEYRKPVWPWASEFEMIDDEEHEPQTIKWEISGTLMNGKGNIYTKFNTDNPDGWYKYSKFLIHSNPLLRANFSYRAARRFGIRDEEFSRVRSQWLANGFARQTVTKNGNGKTVLTKKGEAWVRAMSYTPPSGVCVS
jgi:hypothetical protein